MSNRLQISYVPLDEIRPHTQNPRLGDIKAIAESLKTYSQYKPIVVRRETSEILAGNQTYAAAKMLDWDEIAVVYISVTDTDAKRIVLADNKTHDLGAYNDPLLANILEDLMAEDVTLLDGTGYTEDEVDDLLNSTVTDIQISVEVDPAERDAARAAIDRLFPVTAEQEAQAEAQAEVPPSIQAEMDAALKTDELPTETNVASGAEVTSLPPAPSVVEEYVLFRFGDLKAKVPKVEFDSWRANSEEGDPFKAVSGYLKTLGFGDGSIKPFEMDGPETWHS